MLSELQGTVSNEPIKFQIMLFPANNSVLMSQKNIIMVIFADISCGFICLCEVDTQART